MGGLEAALSVITLLEKLEPAVQVAAVGIINLWHTQGASVPVILQGEVTSLDAIIAKARVEQGVAPVEPVADPDPSPAA